MRRAISTESCVFTRDGDLTDSGRQDRYDMSHRFEERVSFAL